MLPGEVSSFAHGITHTLAFPSWATVCFHCPEIAGCFLDPPAWGSFHCRDFRANFTGLGCWRVSALQESPWLLPSLPPPSLISLLQLAFFAVMMVMSLSKLLHNKYAVIRSHNISGGVLHCRGNPAIERDSSSQAPASSIYQELLQQKHVYSSKTFKSKVLQYLI